MGYRRQTRSFAWLTSISLMLSVAGGTLFTGRVKAYSDGDSARQQTSRPQYPSLTRYGTDLTKLARQGRLRLDGNRSAEIARLVKSLSADTGRNPVLVNNSEAANDTQIAEGLAQRIASGDVPESLREKSVFSLNLDALFAGTKDSRVFASRLKAVMDEAADSRGRVILFVKELHQFVGAYANEQVASVLREALENGRVHIVGAEALAAYSEYIAGDESLTKLFQVIRTDETASASVKEETREEQGFVGEKISRDLREMMTSASAGNGRVSVILQVADVDSPELTALFKRYGITISERMAGLNAVKVEATPKAIEELAANNLTNYMSPDRETVSFGHVTATTGADLVRTPPAGSIIGGLLSTVSSTLDGTGVGIAIIDSGMDTSHKAFALKLTDLSGTRIKFKKDFTTENLPDKDRYGHGTHVASTAAGLSITSGNSYSGIATGVNIINLRVLNSTGTGKTSDLLNALNWILTPADPNKPLSSSNPLNKDKYNIDVVNLSLGAPAIDSYRNDPLCRAVRKLVDAGIVVVAAAGNNGKDADGNKIYGMIHSPGNEPSAITVGAVNTFATDERSDDGIATYSSRGPTRSSYTDASGVRQYDNLIKPDIAAPGNKLIYAEADDGGSNPNLLVKQNPQLDTGISSSDNKKLMYLSGTSMATPVVTGAVAMMLQANPKLTPNLVKAILMYSAQPLAGFNTLEQGAGEINIEGAVRLSQLVRTDLSSSTPVGSPLLTTSTVPTPQTTIAGQTFTWSQGIVLNYGYATGTDLIMKYQKIYGLGVMISDGVMVTDGVMVSDTTMMSDGVVMGDSVRTSGGVVMGDGIVFLPCNQLFGNGVMVSDGVAMGDGVVMGDGVMVGDGVVTGDAAVQAMSSKAMIYGD
jgi:serine protease AprX